MLTRIREHLSGLPRKTRLAIGGGILVLAALAGVLLFLAPWEGPLAYLTDTQPAFDHPDGLVVRLPAGVTYALVQVTTIPREAFLADQAGSAWQAAHQALPKSVMPLSPIYTVKARQGRVIGEMDIPNGAQPYELLDLYRWDGGDRAWEFVPSQIDQARQVIRFIPTTSVINVMAVHAEPISPTVGVIVSPGGPDLGPKYGLALPEGVSVDAQGRLSGQPVPTTSSTVMPIVSRRDVGAINYGDPSQRGSLLSQLEQLVLSYDGLVLDFDPGQGYTEFVAALAKEIHAHGKRVDIVIRGTAFDRYELSGLAQSTDLLWFAPGDNPLLYVPHGQIETALDQLVRNVERSKIGLLVSGLDVDVSGDTVRTLSAAQVLASFGSIQPVSGYSDSLRPGDNLAVRLTGQVTSLGLDRSVAMNYLTYLDAGGQTHYVYFGSPQALEQKLSWAATYNLSGVAVYGLAHPDAPPNLADGLTAFLSQQHLSEVQADQLAWEVKGPDGAQVTQQGGDISLLQFLWQAVANPGQYVLVASLDHQSTPLPIGTLVVNVGQPATAAPTPTPTPTATPRPHATPGAAGTPQAQPTAAPVTGSILAGTFELGGQVNGSIANGDKMVYAGMTWVKFQHKWSPGENPSIVSGNIAEAHGKGFKILLSIPGSENPTAIDFAGYASFVGGAAAQGADAIEVWNEMNLDREWPANDLNGASYVTNMLAPAAAAIRAGNPNTLIISGAPSPTGAFGGCGSVQLPDGTARAGCDDWYYIKQMQQAGAANLVDCIGVHYNAGATSPSATTGHPNDDGSHHYSWYYQPMVNLYYGTFGKPLCFTELGYASTQGVGGGSATFPWASTVTVDEQAQWLSEAAILASQSQKVRLMIIWNVDFSGGEGSDPQAAYAIVRPGGSCPACDALHNAH